MRKLVAFLSFLFISIHTFAQTGALDNFNDNALDPGWTNTAGKFTLTETNSELKIVTTAVGPGYENIKFAFTSVDLTNNPVVSVKVKNATAFNLRVDLIDVTGKSTNSSPVTKAVTASTGYTTYSFDFTGKFNQSSPTAATVDKTKITTAVFFFNAGGSSYTGTVYFDDVTVGDAIPVVPTIPGNIRINQIGYELNGPKIAVYEANQSTLSVTSFDIVNASNVSVFTGTPVSKGAVVGWAGRYFWELDFSSLTQAGVYTVKMGTKVSYQFEIAKNILFNKTAFSVVDFFKGMRNTGTADQSLSFNGPRNDFVNVYGGWRDAAGDPGKHMSHLSYANYFNPQQIPMVTWALLKSYEMAQTSFAAKATDLLSESKWGADYLLRNIDKQQNFLYLSVFDDWGNNPSSREICEWSGSAGTRSANFQAAMREGAGIAIAALARANKMNINGDSTAAQYLKGAIRLYNNLKSPGTGYATKNLEYCNDHQENIIDDYCGLMATIELYKATGQAVYKTDAMAYVDRLVNRMDAQGWFRSDDAGQRPFYHAADEGLVLISLMEYMDIDNSKDASIKNVINKNIQWYFGISKEVTNPFSYIREYYKPYSAGALGTAKKAFFLPHNNETGYWWQGENARLASMTTALMMAARKLDASFTIGTDSISKFGMAQLDWILGKNPFDVCMMYGFGNKNYPNYPASSAIANINGGICNGITAKDSDENDIDWMQYASTDWQNWRWIEQWLPHDLWYLMAVSSIDKVLNNTTPIANFTTSSTTVCAGAAVTFTNTSSGTISSYAWNFGTDASTQTSSSVGPHNISWTTPGDKTVTLTVTGPGGTQTKTTTITVNAVPPVAGTISGLVSVCSGQTGVTYSVSAVTGATSYAWTLPTGANISTGNNTANITVTFGTASGNISVAPTNTCGSAASATSTNVTVNTIPVATITAVGSTTICSGGSVALNANTGTGYTYVWKNGTTTIASATTSSYTANAAGSYTVTVTSNGCSATSAATLVTVNPTPSATITPVTATTFCIGGSVVLNANAGTGYTYVWKNGTTTIGSATTSSYTATSGGSYTVTVTSNSCSATSAATDVTVNATPSATITAVGSTTICSGGSVVLNANTGTGYTYVWKNGTTTIGSATTSSYTANAAGSYTVTITSNNCSATSAATAVTVNPTPTATITPVTTTTFCSGGSVVLNANTGTGYTYVWKNGTTTIASATSSSYTATTTGSYTVTVTSGCSATSNATAVTVNPTPTATITAVTATTFCSGGSIVLNANTGTGYTYIWKNGTTTIASATTSSYTANAAGSYTVTITSNNCSATSAATAVTVNPTPTATITPVTTTTFCSGGSVVLNANTGTGYTYVWKNGTTTIASATSSSYTATTTGSYTVTATSNGCSATSAATAVTVNATPSATITAVGSITFCSGGSVVLNANTGTGFTYVWKNGTTTMASATSSSYTATATGSYTVTITSNNCSATSAATAVTVNATPTATITAVTATTFCSGGSVVLNANTGTGYTYVWKNGTSTISSATASSYTATTAGSYTATVTSNACSATSAPINVSVDLLPSTSSAGSDQNLTSASGTLNASVPSVGTGVWTLISGTGSLANKNSATTIVTGLSQGNNVFRWTVSNGSCASSFDDVTLRVGSNPGSQSIVGPVNVAANTQAVYSIPDNPGSTYHWIIPAGAIIVDADGFHTITVNFGNSGGTLSVVETNQFGSATSSATINVGNLPSTSSISGPSSVANAEQGVVYSVTNNANSTYEWSVPAGAAIVSGQGSSSIVVDFGQASGDVTVTETNLFGSGSPKSSTITVQGPLAVHGISDMKITVSPNPFAGSSVIKLSGSSFENTSATIIDMQGRVVKNIDVLTPGVELSIGEDLGRGVYMLCLIHKDQTQVIRLVKIE